MKSLKDIVHKAITNPSTEQVNLSVKSNVMFGKQESIFFHQG